MTALAVALVLCCAMVCGTRLVLSRRAERAEDVKEVDRRAGKAEATVVELEGRMLSGLGDCAASVTTLAQIIADHRQELDSLKAQSAFRSLG